MRIEREGSFINTLDSVEQLPPVVDDVIKMYCDENGIDESDIYPTIWNDIITEIYIKIFKPCNKLLKLKGSQYNEYDKNNVLYVYNNIYKRITNKHCQEISLKGFIDMVGIDKQTIYNWNDGKNLSCKRFDLHEKIMSDNEESLFALMRDRRNNPMKILPKLNRVHNWNMPGVGSRNEKNAVLTDDKLPTLALTGDSVVQIDDKNSD